MHDKHDTPQAHGIEGLVAMAGRLQELETLFGPQAQPVVRRLRDALQEALAARDRGDAPASIARLGAAMEDLVRLFGDVDPREAAAMGQVVDGFRKALAGGESSAAGRLADEMRRQSGAVERVPGASAADDEP